MFQVRNLEPAHIQKKKKRKLIRIFQQKYNRFFLFYFDIQCLSTTRSKYLQCAIKHIKVLNPLYIMLIERQEIRLIILVVGPGARKNFSVIESYT